ncbi:MAG: glycosyltransferase, partial [Solirubrobacteraceae bacterium]|nr:glycosyltransferase [Solirubrobacteraceae bacterium]
MTDDRSGTSVARVTISIATMNSREQLEACLRTLPEACTGIDWSATVIDNCSDDGTAEMVREYFPSVRLVRNAEPQGFGANHNQVLRLVAADAESLHFALVLNDDTSLAPGSVAALAAALAHEADAGAVVPTVFDAHGAESPVAWLDVPLRRVIAAAFVGRGVQHEDRD